MLSFRRFLSLLLVFALGLCICGCSPLEVPSETEPSAAADIPTDEDLIRLILQDPHLIDWLASSDSENYTCDGVRWFAEKHIPPLHTLPQRSTGLSSLNELGPTLVRAEMEENPDNANSFILMDMLLLFFPQRAQELHGAFPEFYLSNSE